MGRKRDVFWQYVDTDNGNKCIFCGQGIPGASRIKFHLAQIKGGGISGCDNVPSDVQSAAASAINKNSSKRVKQSRSSNNLDDNIINSNLSSDSSRGKIEGHLLPTTDLVGEQFQTNVERIWEWLMKDDVSPVMGVWGMAGVGKTALLKHIHNKLLNDNHNVIWVTVSQNNILEIQRVIAKSVGAFISNEDDKMKISGKLLDAFKRINKCVIILDDVWSDILLEDIGIPLINNDVRVIITSRSFDVCTSIGCKRNIVKVELLSEKETWDFFAKNLEDDGTLPSEVKKIAKSLAEGCEGLPLAIVTIAKSMRGWTDIEDWRSALSKLRSIEKDQDDIKRLVFPALKFSFDHLNDSTLQDCFLCLPLYCDAGEIKKEKLIRKFVDEGLINGKQSLEAQLDEVQSILNKLVNNSLLNKHDEQSNGFLCHELVWAMAVHIGKESRGYMVKTELPDEQEWKEDFQKVCLLNIVEIPYDMSPRCPKLSVFLMNYTHPLKVIPDNFFINMPYLKILDLSHNDSMEGLPASISNLECLTVLLVFCCDSLLHIPSLAKLRRLRRLDLSQTAITKMPQGFENLTNLRWLHLLETRVRLKAQDLEGLKMLESIAIIFDSKDEFNAYVQIIQARINSRVPMRGYFLHLQRYSLLDDYIENDIDKDKVVMFEGLENSTLILPTDINELKIYCCYQWKNICDVLSSHGKNDKLNISRCTVTECDELDYLFCSSGNCTLCSSLQSLNALYLDGLDNLSMLCKENQVTSPFYPFLYVRTLNICRCKGIKTLMTPGMSRQLHNLEEMTVEYCVSMEEIFSSGRNINREVNIDVDMIPLYDSVEEIFSLGSNNEVEIDQTDAEVINLPNLKRMNLSYLPRLTIVCKGTMRCDSFEHFSIINCPKLRVPQIEPSFPDLVRR